MSLEVPPALTGFTLKPAVTFEGSPETLNATEPLPDVFTSTEPLAPRVTVSVVEDNETVKDRLIVTDTVVEWTPLPLIVTVNGPPGVAFGAAVTVRVEVMDPFAGGVTDGGLNVHVAPTGQLAAARVTGLLNPNFEVTVIVEVEKLPCITVNDVGLADIEKSGGGFTVKETVVK